MPGQKAHAYGKESVRLKLKKGSGYIYFGLELFRGIVSLESKLLRLLAEGVTDVPAARKPKPPARVT